MAALLSWPGALRAQTRLYVVEDNVAHVVRSAKGTSPYFIDASGKLQESDGMRFALKSVSEYFPIIVEVGDLEVKTNYLMVNGGVNHINNNIEVHAKLSSPAALDRVFVVLELSQDMGRGVFLWGVGKINPGEVVPIAISVPTISELGAGHFKLHVFSDGVEVFNSTMGLLNVYSFLDQMAFKRTQGVTNAKPAALMGYPPEYPMDLKERHLTGEAVLDVVIDNRGRPEEEKVVSATDPQFGAAAQACVAGWRFVPMVKDGIPSRSVARIPFEFTLPKNN